MTFWHALYDELFRGAVQSAFGFAIVAAQLALYIALRQTKPNIRFHKLKDYGNERVAFLIRNLDSVRHNARLVVALAPCSAIERTSVHAGPYSDGPPAPDPDGARLLIAFRKVPADATFTIKVRLVRNAKVRLQLAPESELRPRSFDDKLAPFRGARRFSYFFARGLAGLIGFVGVLVIGLFLDGDAPGWSDWAYLGAALPIALATFVLVVPTGGKPIVAGYLGWSGASKDWSAPAPSPPAAAVS